MSTSSRAGSRQSKASSVGRYRTKAKVSEIDDLLFGSSSSNSTRTCNPITHEETLHFTQEKSKTLPPPCKINPKSRKPETLRVITKDLIRDVVVPADDPQSRKVLINRGTYDLLSWKATSSDLTDAEIKKSEDKAKDAILADMAKRKAVLNAYDLKRSENTPLNDLEAESQTLAVQLQERYRRQRLEQNDEIRHLNELILEAKCHAIRDDQIQEKDQLRAELQHENNRLDAMMEIDRIHAIEQQEAICKARKERRQRGAAMIMDQIKANETERLFEVDRRDKECKMMVENQEKLQMQDLAEIERRKLQQKELQQEIDAINEVNLKAKAVRAEQERIAEERVLAYQRAKEERERQLEEEAIRIRVEKEIEIAKLRQAQERASDLQAERDALRAKRHEEQTEREYRRKVREDLARKQRMEADMATAREEQISGKRHLSAVQAARERAEFDKQLLEQTKEVERMQEQQAHRQDNLKNYASAVRCQIAQREEQRIKDRKQFYEETITLDQSIEEDNRKLEEVKRDKLRTLKESGVPEKYVHEVARRIGLTSI